MAYVGLVFSLSSRCSVLLVFVNKSSLPVFVVDDLDLTSGNSAILSGLENLEDLHLYDTSMLTRHRRP